MSDLIQALNAAEARARRGGFSPDPRTNTVIIETVRGFLWCMQFGATPAEISTRAQKFLDQINERYGREAKVSLCCITTCR